MAPIAVGPRRSLDGKASERFQIVAASPRFFVISPEYMGQALASGDVRTIPVDVHDKSSGIWKTITVAANVPRSRLLGVWLATIVENYNPDNTIVGNGGIPAGDGNPGRENERVLATALLPSVSMSYAAFVGGQYLIPGVLVLNNLLDGRKITIHTHQEDSEILDVRKDGLVLYRVNDSIYSARIQGDKLSASMLVVKDEDVPEVHWAFWSNAGARTGASRESPRAAQR